MFFKTQDCFPSLQWGLPPLPPTLYMPPPLWFKIEFCIGLCCYDIGQKIANMRLDAV